MTIDEAIAHALEVAERQEYLSTQSIFLKAREKCAECAAEHRQLAEWLTELKEAKRLLKSAIDEWHIVCEWGNCGEYCGWFKDGKCTQEWSRETEALKLIGEDEDDI